MIRIAAYCLGVMLLAFACGGAIAQSKAPEAEDIVSLRSVPTTEDALQKLGVKNLNAAEVARMTTKVALLSRRLGGGRLSYTCTSETNTCVCHGWLDCVLVMDECKGVPTSDGKLCDGGAPCTCNWH